MDRPSISCLLAHYITNSCYIIIPYFNSCTCSCYPITITHQNKGTDFSVWLCGFLAGLRKTGEGEEGEKKSRGELEGKTRAGLSFSHGKVCQCFSAKLDSSRSAKSSVLSTGVGCWAPAAPTAAKQVTASLRTELPVSQTIAVPAAPSTRHAAVVYPRGFQALSSHHCMQTLTYSTWWRGDHRDTGANIMMSALWPWHKGQTQQQ